MKISILEKMRAPSRNVFCEGLGFGCSASHVVVGHKGLDIGLVAHEAKGDLDVEGRSYLLGQLLNQFDVLAAVCLEDPVLFAGTTRAVAEPDRSEKPPARLSCDEAEQVFPRLCFGILTQDTDRTGLDQRVRREAGARREVESLREKKPPDFDRKGLLIVNEFYFVAHCLLLSRYYLTASSHHDLISCYSNIIGIICQEQQKITISGVSRLLTLWIKKFSFPQIQNIVRTDVFLH